MTKALEAFKNHIRESSEAVEIYEFLKGHGYSANFGLRYVWVASISALDRYVSELIIEKATEHFANGIAFSNKLLNETVPVAGLISIFGASPAEATVRFRALIADSVRYRTFQKAKDVADGLSLIWNEQHKWDAIGLLLEIPSKSARAKLNSIAIRRDLIVHNADYDEVSGLLTRCMADDAAAATNYVSQVVNAIDALIP